MGSTYALFPRNKMPAYFAVWANSRKIMGKASLLLYFFPCTFQWVDVPHCIFQWVDSFCAGAPASDSLRTNGLHTCNHQKLPTTLWSCQVSHPDSNPRHWPMVDLYCLLTSSHSVYLDLHQWYFRHNPMRTSGVGRISAAAKLSPFPAPICPPPYLHHSGRWTGNLVWTEKQPVILPRDNLK